MSQDKYSQLQNNNKLHKVVLVYIYIYITNTSVYICLPNTYSAEKLMAPLQTYLL